MRRGGGANVSHLHVPDGVLPLWLVAVGWLGAVLVLALALARATRSADLRRQVPLLGIMAAVMLVGMSTEFVPIGYHLNLTVLVGIVLGPALGALAGFVVGLILALFGHGGITVVGLNTLVLGAECALGWLVFRTLYRALASRVSAGALAGLATVITLFCTTWLVIGLVALSNTEPGRLLHPAPVVENPTLGGALSEGIVGNVLIGEEKELMTRPSSTSAPLPRCPWSWAPSAG